MDKISCAYSEEVNQRGIKVKPKTKHYSLKQITFFIGKDSRDMWGKKGSQPAD